MNTSMKTRVSFAFPIVLLLMVASLSAQKAIAQRSTRQDCSTVDDATLSGNISAKIAATQSLNGQNVSATVKSGVVTLTGNVSSAAMKNLAAGTAGSVKCVKRVVNRLVITPTILHDDYVCCCDGFCYISNQRCPPCGGVKDCAETYKAAVIAAGKHKAALAAAREAFYECICKAP